jgi:hypothetical protein
VKEAQDAELQERRKGFESGEGEGSQKVKKPEAQNFVFQWPPLLYLCPSLLIVIRAVYSLAFPQSQLQRQHKVQKIFAFVFCFFHYVAAICSQSILTTHNKVLDEHFIK